jgi:hypothetical protein
VQQDNERTLPEQFMVEHGPMCTSRRLAVPGGRAPGPCRHRAPRRAERHARAREDLDLLPNSEPIPEPVAGYGPFVMNSEAEIRKALLDYQGGRMGQLT